MARKFVSNTGANERAASLGLKKGHVPTAVHTAAPTLTQTEEVYTTTALRVVEAPALSEKPVAKKGGLLATFARTAIVLVVLVGIGITGMGAYGFHIYRNMVKQSRFTKIPEFRPPQLVQVVSREGDVVGEILPETPDGTKIKDGARIVVPLDQIPNHMRLAMIDIEDERFMGRQTAIDFIAVARALKHNLFRKLGLVKKIKQGASTITLQVAKYRKTNGDAKLLEERKLNIEANKMDEATLGMAILDKYTKEEILWMYLNLVSFGRNRHGVEAAAQFYFGKHIKDVTLAEAAALAALPNSPEVLSNPANAAQWEARRKLVLRKMVELGHITAEQHQSALNEVMTINFYQPEYKLAPRFVAIARDAVKTMYPTDWSTRGLVVRTTLNSRVQRVAMDSCAEQTETVQKRNKLKRTPYCFVMVQDPTTGEVLALVGDPTKAEFQVGSLAKTPTYGLALDAKLITLTSGISNSPDGLGEFAPRNHGDSADEVKTESATYMYAHSDNRAAYRVMGMIGVKNYVAQMALMGVPGLRLEQGQVLGQQEISLEGITKVYSSLATGTYKPPVYIVAINDVKLSTTEPVQVLQNPETPYVLGKMAQATVEYGTANAFKKSFEQAGILPACKTGTTNISQAGWLACWTPNLVVVSGLGHPLQQSMGKNEFGSTLGGPVTTKVMVAAVQTIGGDHEFHKPETVVEVAGKAYLPGTAPSVAPGQPGEVTPTTPVVAPTAPPAQEEIRTEQETQ
jgi:penicillin-binding protein 1A